MKNRVFAVLPLSLTIFCAACADMPSEGSEESPEPWSPSDDPTLFDTSLERVATALPDEGEASPIPWAGSYWPTASDSINYKWDGKDSMSPAKKYEVAFGLQSVEDKVSKYHGIDSRASSSKLCEADSECNSDLGEICAMRDGREAGRCIPTWFGICHAWAPAAILMPEPKHEVVKNGVTFKVADIKALASLVHNTTKSKFIALRCDNNDRSGGVAWDEDGRAESACRDTNAGTYHIVLANYLGLRKQSFVEDRTFDYEVWNQPMRGYKILSKKPVSAQEANRLIGVKLVGGESKESQGTVAAGAWSHVQEIPIQAGDTYTVEMTGTGDADLYVQFGAQPSASSSACRSTGGSSREKCTGTAPEGATMMYVSALGYDGSSDFTVKTTTGRIPDKYAFNPSAVSLLYVKNVVSYIGESDASDDGNLSSRINSYTGRDTYEYILELDDKGTIIGGEWVGTSKKNHPDFLWLPTGVGARSVAGGAIKYKEVKEIVDASIAPQQ